MNRRKNTRWIRPLALAALSFGADAIFGGGKLVREYDWQKEAFGQGHYEVSYHALAAALHCALLLEEQALLTALEQRASEQRDWIDSSAPPAFHSP